ncbi:hypothetical protein ACFL9T_14605 [Thermodesulfobacteriota bacterium]
MKLFQKIILLMGCVCLMMIIPEFGYPAEPGDPSQQSLNALLKELEKKIEDADKRMIAHPKFLDELRAMVEKYRSQLREVYFRENFADGDYKLDPGWIVNSGRFQVTPSRRLWSRIYAEPPSTPSTGNEKPDPVGIILKELMRQKTEDVAKKESLPAEKDAVIHTLTRIGPAFEMDMIFVSESRWGSMEIVLLGGNPPIPRYRMVYHAAASAERPIQIVRERGSRKYLLESALKYPSLDDGVPHRIQWIRDFQGRMIVLVDGKEVLSTIEVFYRTDFTGLALENHGGTYEWGPIRILEAPNENP